MAGEAATVALMRAEALLAAGEHQEVPTICRAAIERFNQIGVSENATAALSFLREALARGGTTPAVVRHVREYLERATEEPDLLFSPPPV
jgi:hypothetical protein